VNTNSLLLTAYTLPIHCLFIYYCPAIDLSGTLAFEVADEPCESREDETYVEPPVEPGDPDNLLGGCPPRCRFMLQFIIDNYKELEESDLIDSLREKARSEEHHKTNKGPSRTCRPALPMALRWWTRTGWPHTLKHGCQPPHSRCRSGKVDFNDAQTPHEICIVDTTSPQVKQLPEGHVDSGGALGLVVPGRHRCVNPSPSSSLTSHSSQTACNAPQTQTRARPARTQQKPNMHTHIYTCHIHTHTYTFTAQPRTLFVPLCLNFCCQGASGLLAVKTRTQ
jgi:hypothetical protein